MTVATGIFQVSRYIAAPNGHNDDCLYKRQVFRAVHNPYPCLLYTSDAADERSSVDLGGRRIINKKTQKKKTQKKQKKNTPNNTAVEKKPMYVRYVLY